MHATPTALRDLVADGSTGSRWRVTGGRPLFELDRVPQPGWYLVTTRVDGLRSDGGADAPSETPVALRFLPETGSVVIARRPIPTLGRNRARVVHVPEGTGRVHLEVSPWLTTVEAGPVTFRRLRQGVAASMMSADVAASSVAGSTDRAWVTRHLRSSSGVRDAIERIAVAYEHLQHRRSGDGVDYPSWRIRNATIFDDDVERLRDEFAGLPGGGPSISVVMPVYEPEERWLRAAIDSVRAQVYEKWQLCLVDDASPNPRVREILDEYAAADPRVHVQHRRENGHIVAATNDALAVATGEFVAFMDHDDELAPYALGLVALAAEAADVVYTDEDKIDENGRHYEPHCKPDWNPELLLGQNYLSHLTAIRRSLVGAVGGVRAGFDGSQDHDLLLRVTEATTPDRIVHVPFIAYHWRAVAGSTAAATDAKDYTETASIEALRDRLGAGWNVQVARAPTAYRCTPPLDDFPLVTILIPTRDRVALLRQCVESLARTTYPAFEIIVIDNDSTDPATLDWLAAFDNGLDHRVVAAPGAFNYSRVNNIGASEARGELILLLNNDTEVIEPNWLSEMVRWIQQPDVGVVGAKLLYPDDTIQHAGVVLGLGGLAGHGHHLEDRDAYGYFSRLTIAHEVGAVTGACLLTRRSTWLELGGLDEDLAVAFNDIDYCLRVRHVAHQRIIWTPEALLYHHESVSRGAEDDAAKVARFNDEVERNLDRWGELLHLDPAYSPNLTLEGAAFTLARQPRVEPAWRGGEGSS